MAEDAKLSRRYRELGQEEPPQALDDAILAAARRAAETRPAPLVVPAGRRRWYFPLAAATVIVLAVAVTVQVERHQPDAEALPAPSPEMAKEEPLLQARPDAGQPKPPPKPSKPAPTFTPDPQPQARQAPSELARESAPAASDSAGVASPAPAPRLLAKPEPRLATGGLTSNLDETPAQWLERIARMRQLGQHEEADKALAEFRRRHPDYRIPGPMLQKVERQPGDAAKQP